MAWSYQNQSPLLSVISWYSTNHWLRQNNLWAAFKVRLSIPELRFARVCLLCLYWVLLKASPLGQRREPQFANPDRAGNSWAMNQFPLSSFGFVSGHRDSYDIVPRRPRKKKDKTAEQNLQNTFYCLWFWVHILPLFQCIVRSFWVFRVRSIKNKHKQTTVSGN